MNEIHQGVNKFYIGENEKAAVAEITYIPKGENEYIVNHTFVDESMRGQGVGLLLIDKMVELARQENRKIIPRCSFVSVMMNRMEKYKDVLAEGGSSK